VGSMHEIGSGVTVRCLFAFFFRFTLLVEAAGVLWEGPINTNIRLAPASGCDDG